MFRNWNFLIGEIWGLLALAALLGLFVGWLIWGRMQARLKSDLKTCQTGHASKDSEITSLKASLGQSQAAASEAGAKLQTAEASAAAQVQKAEAAAAAQVSKAETAAAASAAFAAAAKEREAAAKLKAKEAVAAAKATPKVAAAKPKAKPAAKKSSKPSKPKTLKAARGGKADDLKLIKGIGPQMEQICNKLGFFHFDQIAAWTKSDLAWVDDNLDGFKGRASRDEWVKQAKILAKGGSTEFSRR